jgi:ABC-2 type transport system permease protein
MKPIQIILANLLAIYRRELQSYFRSPWAYLIAAVYWFITGILFVSVVLGLIAQVVKADQDAGGQALSIDLAYEVIRSHFGTIGPMSLFILPILSMGLYAEERKRGTLELLATSPITNWAVAVGKLAGAVTFFATMSLPIMIYEAITLATANPPISPLLLLVGHGSLILMAAAVLSLGMFISSLTDNTIVAAIGTFGLVILLSIIDLLAKAGGPIGDTLAQLSILRHYTNLVQGIVETPALVVFGSYILLGIFLTAQSIEAFRFQRS